LGIFSKPFFFHGKEVRLSRSPKCEEERRTFLEADIVYNIVPKE